MSESIDLPMVVGFDYWQVVSHYPATIRHLAKLHRAAGDTVHIVSAVGRDRAGTVATAVKNKGFDPKYYKVHEVVFDQPSESPALKLAKCRELGIVLFYDDRDDVCRMLNKNGIVSMRVTRQDNSRYDLGAEQGAPFKNAAPVNRPRCRAKVLGEGIGEVRQCKRHMMDNDRYCQQHMAAAKIKSIDNLQLNDPVYDVQRKMVGRVVQIKPGTAYKIGIKYQGHEREILPEFYADKPFRRGEIVRLI